MKRFGVSVTSAVAIFPRTCLQFLWRVDGGDYKPWSFGGPHKNLICKRTICETGITASDLRCALPFILSVLYVCPGQYMQLDFTCSHIMKVNLGLPPARGNDNQEPYTTYITGPQGEDGTRPECTTMFLQKVDASIRSESHDWCGIRIQ